MIQKVKNADGFIYAYTVYQVVDINGQFKEGGEYCFVEDLWIHPIYRRDEKRKILNYLISLIDKDKLVNNVKYVYWLNRKHNERKTPTYMRNRLSKLGGR